MLMVIFIFLVKLTLTKPKTREVNKNGGIEKRLNFASIISWSLDEAFLHSSACTPVFLK
jgi:hypothetical protein